MDPAGVSSRPSSRQEPAADFLAAGAAITLEKSTNGEDADVAPGPSLTPGDVVVWEYQVTNSGTELLFDVQVSDDQEGAICAFAILNVGQQETCRLEGVAEEGQYENVGSASGRSVTLSLAEDSDPSHYVGAGAGGPVPAALEIGVELKPGEEFPCINALSKGRTPVALLGSAEFDVLSVDPSTIMAGDVSPVHFGGPEDVNADGFLDLVVHFRTQDLNDSGLLIDGEDLTISGETMEGASFAGSDLVRLTTGPYCQ